MTLSEPVSSVEDGFELEFAEVAGLPPCRLPLGSCVDVRFERAAPVRSFVWTGEIPLDDEVEQVPQRGAVLLVVEVKPGQASAAHGRRVHVARPRCTTPCSTWVFWAWRRHGR